MHTLREQSLGAVVYWNVSIPRWMPNEIRLDLDSTRKYYAENIRLKAHIATLQDILGDGYEEFEPYIWNGEDKIKSLNEQLKWYIEYLHGLIQSQIIELDSSGKRYAENFRLIAYIATLQDILQDGYEEFEHYTWNEEDKIKTLNEQLKWYIADLHGLCQERGYIVSQMFELSPLEKSDYDYMESNSMLDFDDFTRDGLGGQYVQYKRIAKIKVSGNLNEDATAAIAAVCEFCAIKKPYKVKLKGKKIVLY